MTRPDGLEFKTLAVANPAEPDTHGVIEALVAVTGVKDEVNDYIEPGAFRRTLSDRPKPKVCLGHDWNRPIGKTLEIRELLPGDRRLPKETADGRPWPRTAGALWARFQVNLDSDDGRSAFSAAKFYGPEQSTYSIGYRTARAKQRGPTRHIQDLDLFEYGPVLNPANRLATLQSIKSDQELTNPVDSERQDFETGDGAVEAKTKYVRDATYWGKPLGTPITPGMKPRGGNDREHGTSEKPERTGSFFSSLPSDEQDFARSLPTDQRIKYLDARAAGKDHDEAAREAQPQSAPKKPESAPVRAETDKPRETAPAAESKPATKPKKPAGPKKLTAKQKALLFDARPGRVMTWRRDDNGRRIYNAPFPAKEGLIFQGHANSAFPMEKAGWVEAGTDGRHYILTPQGERLRAQLESEDSDRQAQLHEEQRSDSTPLRRDAEPVPVDAPTPAVEAPSPPKPAPAAPPKLTAPEPPPEREALPYEVIKKPNRSGKGARIRYNGREYSVDATTGVLAEVTVTDDDGHSATVAGGSSTLLRRDQFADRERALRQALARAEAQHNAEEQSRPQPEAEPPTPETEPPAVPAPVEPELATIPAEQVDEAAALQDEVLGITEQPDGTIEVTEEVAARQDRVAALIEQDDAGTLSLGDKSEPELTNTRQDLSEELRLQFVLATRQAIPKPEIVTSPAGAPEKPPQRPGLAGAAEDYSEALQSGDPEAITRTRARLESSLRRSRAGSESARALADHITGEGDDNTETLTQLAQRMRRESRERRNTAARRRRTARRLERVRIQSLIDKVDSELQSRARSAPTSQPKANADRPREERAERVTHRPGDRVQSEYGRGTVVEQTDRSLRYRLDSGEELNVVVGTPGYDRVRPINEADTLAANYLEMHGASDVRAMVGRLRARKNLSAGDQALLAALENLLGKAPAGVAPA
jgi:hypothetical protein